jgi:hypothetical protein
MTRRTLIVFALLLPLAGFANAAAPKVVTSSPDNGETDVDPATKEIRVEFDQPIDPVGRSLIGGGDTFPKVTGDLKWLNPKTLVIPVKLEAEHQYHLGINNDRFRNFTNPAGQPVEWYPISFKTRAQGAAPAEPDVTPEQNKAALEALAKAIDEVYAYRDRKKVDWANEIAARREKFEKAKSANEFARLAAHLLRLAEDAHVWVEAGDMTIGTRTNSSPPNFDFQSLKAAVPGWAEGAGGIVTGRFEDGIGYVAFSACTKEQADAIDAAIDDLKDTKALVLDVRFNGGGDEAASQRVAGRFVKKAAVYSRDRIREGGKWNGPFDRVVEPRDDAARYDKPVAVLIGPKVVSSAESFVLMMKHGAGAKLFGDATKGSSGRPLPHQLGNGVAVYLPSWEDQLPDGTVIEGRGVRPDFVVKTNPRELRTSDAVLLAALKYLRGLR